MRIPAHRRAFGNRVRELRLEQEWAQETFAHHLDMDRTYVSGIERGARNPTLDVIVRLSHGLGVKPLDLLSGVEIDAGRQGMTSRAGNALRVGQLMHTLLPAFLTALLKQLIEAPPHPRDVPDLLSPRNESYRTCSECGGDCEPEPVPT